MPIKIKRKDDETKREGQQAHDRRGSVSMETGDAVTADNASDQEVQPFVRGGSSEVMPQRGQEPVVGNRGMAPEVTPAVKPSSGAPVTHDIAAQRSFTLYKKDCQLIRDVQVHFLQNGSHVTESQVVRIALRALEISEKLQDLHTQIRGEDGRKHRQSAQKPAA